MDLRDRVESLDSWGEKIKKIPSYQLNSLFEKAHLKNRWFTKDSCSYSLNEILKWLTSESLTEWIKSYDIKEKSNAKSVGLVMAGNIPLVGFHDLLSVLISGHSAKVKLSSQDDELLPYLIKLLLEQDSRWQDSILYVDRLKDIDAVIATGSDNSARYFEHYFKNIPRIIRKNRTSVAVIMGEENPKEFELLADDIFTYFGMGCRNVSKIFIPENFDLEILRESFIKYGNIIDHNKYANNYEYQKTIRIISSKPFHDMHFLLLVESEELVSPISIIYYQYYTDQTQLDQLLKMQSEKIQCIASAGGWAKGSVPFGKSQQPSLRDYADGIDTMKFLQSL